MIDSFDKLNLSKQLLSAIAELGFTVPTPVQNECFSVIMSGKDVIGIAQTGTGKTLAYVLPILQQLKYSDQINPRVLILVPTRELVLQVVKDIEEVATYQNVRIIGVYGGTNINTQKQKVIEGCDILVATPGRLYDLAVSGVLQLKSIYKLVIDEVDVMLDLGFRHQLTNIFELLPDKRQNLMFSATMTEDVARLINQYFRNPEKISIAVSGTRLENIYQKSVLVPNFFTKVNLLSSLLEDNDEFSKVLVFTSSKKHADKLFELLEENYGSEMVILHSNKSQNYRIRSLEQFDVGERRIMISTDVMARGIDIEDISHVINFDTPSYPENYMHRIGRTGRVDKKGTSLLFFSESETEYKQEIESLMNYIIPQSQFPEGVEISNELYDEEQPPKKEGLSSRPKTINEGKAFHEKKLKNQKTNQGGSWRRKSKKHKNPKTRGDKVANKRKNKR
ncbi:MAG: DEAD/DEAH box helicase [Bacteroidales bacterium]|jgi:ATP-dependent RNA helicase RhlE|nr:DEAD/DEAH box helicase [Bacteroidales bacterium]MDG1901805.1 DEAD/DEAH box helicase [Bacteroidales bacterium]MDG2081129.1 DEAD/DEAH box helicase [Bacteroidales bacterium]|tara:strand:+ start:377 stop:1726 length:1350 start_codon:yes stop_codon:yes gene_type:complete